MHCINFVFKKNLKINLLMSTNRDKVVNKFSHKPRIKWESGAISHPVPQLWLEVFSMLHCNYNTGSFFFVTKAHNIPYALGSFAMIDNYFIRL